MNKDLSYGLNPRTNAPPASRKRKGLSGFDSDSSGTPDDAPTGRSATNKAITAEQNALRKRAEAALTEYDFDGEYESFTKNKPPPKKVEDKSSKYVSKLLQTSQRRTREQEIIYERKIAKEQALEDAEMQYDGKEKFITSSYKRKLAEREEWLKEEKEREKREQEEDVTKKDAGGYLFAEFGRNMLSSTVGEGKYDAVENLENKKSRKADNDGHKINEADHHRDSSKETEHWGHASRNRVPGRDYSRSSLNQMISSTAATYGGLKTDKPEVAPPKTRKQILEERAVKLREARERYFHRKGIKPSQ
jgi:coiled-coil domain-containing protein 55